MFANVEYVETNEVEDINLNELINERQIAVSTQLSPLCHISHSLVCTQPSPMHLYAISHYQEGGTVPRLQWLPPDLDGVDYLSAAEERRKLGHACSRDEIPLETAATTAFDSDAGDDGEAEDSGDDEEEAGSADSSCEEEVRRVRVQNQGPCSLRCQDSQRGSMLPRVRCLSVCLHALERAPGSAPKGAPPFEDAVCHLATALVRQTASYFLWPPAVHWP
jgi:hypothetical protein